VSAPTPVDVSDLDIAFPASVGHLLPAWADIPEEFRHWPGNGWVRFVDNWFFKGTSTRQLKAKPGIDKNAALRHVRACMGSFEPKHEHKTAGVAYLLSLWFEPLGEGG
jgi:hypothetical protein